MDAVAIALFVGSTLSIVLNGLYCFQLGVYLGLRADSDPVFLRVIVYSFSVFDVFHTATMACIGWDPQGIFLHPQTFLRLYATIRSWNVPISAAAYGFYAFHILRLSGSWKIPLVIVSLVLTQIAGTVVWTLGTVAAKSSADLMVGNSMMMAGTLLCTVGASLCSACVPVSMIFYIHNNTLWRSRILRELLIDFQLISVRLHLLVMLVAMADLIGYFFFPKDHVSIVMAIIVGQVWLNTLMYGLNSRRGLRATFHTPQTTTYLATIKFAPPRRRSKFLVGDHKLSMELTEMGGSDGGSIISTPELEQDLSLLRLSGDGKDGGEVGDHHTINIRLSEEINRGAPGGRSSAPI